MRIENKPAVLMSADIKLRLLTDTLDRGKLENVSLQSCRFKVQGKDIPVEFSTSSASIIENKGNGNENTINYLIHIDTGYSPFGNDFTLDERLEPYYREQGLSFEDVTADFLSKAESIESICMMFEYDHGRTRFDEYEIVEMGGIFTIENMSFSDLNMTYNIEKPVLDSYTLSFSVD